MNRCRLLLVTMFVVTVIVVPCGITFADQDPAAAKQAAEKDAASAKRKADAAVRARQKRDAAIKQRKAAKEYVKKVVEGQQSGAAATAPGN